MLFFRSAEKAMPDHDDPWQTAKDWLSLAKHTEPSNPTAAALGTADSKGRPSCRMVLVKHIGADGLHFCSYSGSFKDNDLTTNPQASLLFYWKSLGRQIRFEQGKIMEDRRLAEVYFAARSRLSNLAAHASRQSQVLASRQDLEDALSDQLHRWKDKPLPVPDNWKAYVFRPTRIEFWADGVHRLHHRVEYLREDEGEPWTRRLLNP